MYDFLGKSPMNNPNEDHSQDKNDDLTLSLWFGSPKKETQSSPSPPTPSPSLTLNPPELPQIPTPLSLLVPSSDPNPNSLSGLSSSDENLNHNPNTSWVPQILNPLSLLVPSSDHNPNPNILSASSSDENLNPNPNTPWVPQILTPSSLFVPSSDHNPPSSAQNPYLDSNPDTSWMPYSFFDNNNNPQHDSNVNAPKPVVDVNVNAPIPFADVNVNAPIPVTDENVNPPVPVDDVNVMNAPTPDDDVPEARALRTRRPPSKGLGQGKSNTVPVLFPWATNLRATVHSHDYLIKNNITIISGRVQCKKCDQEFEMSLNLEEEVTELTTFIRRQRGKMHDRAPAAWSNPVLPRCIHCGKENSAKPVIMNVKKKAINWLFLFLSQTLGCCTLDQLRYFCKHTNNHRTGAKDRLIYLAYMTILKQLFP